MRKNNKLLLIAIVLVVSMLFTVMIGCVQEGTGVTDTPVVDNGQDNGDNGNNSGNGGVQAGTDNGSTDEGKTYTITDADAYITFEINAQDENDVVVKNSTGAVVDVDVKKDGDTYKVWAPVGGYEKGKIYKIELTNGATFVNYPDVTRITFIIASNIVNNIKINSGYVTYSQSIVQDEKSYGVDANGVEKGYVTLKLNTNTGLEKDTIFLIEEESGLQSAYKVESCTQIANGLYNINYVKPDMDEVFAEFNYSGSSKLDKNSDVEFVYDDNSDILDNSELAMSIFSVFGKAPQFNVSTPQLVDNQVIIEVTITIPEVVTVEGYASSDLVITIKNVMTAEAFANIDKDNIAEEFSLFATIRNDITTTVSLGGNVNVDEAVNLPDLIDKLIELSNNSADDATAIPMIKWTVPIANGAASITYNADLLFRFNVAGSIDAVATAQLDYQVGVQYTQADGIEAIAQELEGNGFDSLTIAVQGKGELKIGLRQGLSFDVLAGVLGIGLQAEIGNYNRLYGYGESSNLIDEDKNDYFVGGVYFEGGFYYDIDLTYGVKIGSLLNLNNKADLVAGEVKLYEAGEREIVLGLATVNNITAKDLTAKNTVVPSIYVKKMMDIVTGERYDVVASVEELEFTVNSDKLVVENGVIKVNQSVSNIIVAASLKGMDLNTVEVAYSFNMASPVLDNDRVVLDKSSVSDVKQNLTATIFYEGFENGATVTSEDVVVNTVETGVDFATIQIPVKQLLSVANGMKEVVLDVAGNKLVLNVEISGNVAWDQFRSGNSVEIFTADQVVSLINSGLNFDAVTINVTEDIDMNGANIGSIANFKGILNGNNHTISNYTVNAFAGNNAGFIAVNEGTVQNINLAGNVNVNLSAKTDKDYAVAGIVAVNNGTVVGSSFTGNVNVYSTSLAAFVDIDAAAVVAKGSALDCTAQGEVVVTVKFDLANVSVNVGGMNSTTKADGVVGKVLCENGAKDVPVITKYTIA